MRYRFLSGVVAVLLVVLLAACGPIELETLTAVPSPAETMTEAPMETPTEAATGEPTTVATAEPGAGGMPVTADNLTAADFSVGLELVAEGFTQPVNLTHAGDGSGRVFVVDQVGQIYIVDGNGQKLEEPFLDISDRLAELDEDYDERGLLGLAFHPDYANNGRLFVYYGAPLRDGAPAGWNNTTHLSEFTVSSDNADRADPDSERILLQVDQPQPNHEGGQIRFGPDGYLYIPLGDGGAADDVAEGHVEDWYAENEGGNGQDVSQNLLGSILRIDVDSGDPYGIPEDNPVLGDNTEADEQWAYGFRNPYSMHFDTGGENWLLVGDAGQDRWEEVHVVQAGGNYGWNVYEGTHCFDAANPEAEDAGTCPETDPEGDPLIMPVVEFGNLNQPYGVGLTVVGGTIYRGSSVPALDGMYVFGSWSASWSQTSGQLFVAEPGSAEGGLWPTYALPTTEDAMGLLGDEAILAFGVDESGELYLLTTTTIGPSGENGRVYRFVSAGE